MKKLFSLLAVCLVALSCGCIYDDYDEGEDGLTVVHTGKLVGYEFIPSSARTGHTHVLTFEDAVVRLPNLMNETVPLNVKVTVFKSIKSHVVDYYLVEGSG